MTFRAMRQGGGRPNIQFDDCETQFSSRNLLERRAIYIMLESSGWTRDRKKKELGANRGYTSEQEPAKGSWATLSERLARYSSLSFG